MFSVTCSNCGAAVRPDSGAPFACPECGAALAPDGSAARCTGCSESLGTDFYLHHRYDYEASRDIDATDTGEKRLETIPVYYDAQEVGPAELLGDGLARIVKAPVFGEICRNAIVRLDRDPHEAEGFPKVAEVLHMPYPCLTTLEFMEADDERTLINILALVQAEAEVVGLPEGDRPGLLRVFHHEFLDPECLAEAIGIPQPLKEADDGPEGVAE